MAIGINMDDTIIDGAEDKKKTKKEERASLKDRIRKNSTIKESSILSKSKFFNVKDMITTPIPMINVALSGRLDGGFAPGLTIWAGKSKHFKTSFCLLMAKAYLDTYQDAVLLFYDSEFGTPKSYFEAFGIDKDRVVHTPLLDIEQLKFDIMAQLQDVYRGDKLFILVDSLGNLASKKEVEDALSGNSVADMTRAKQIKSLFRMVTPHLNLKDIPMAVVSHTYQTQEMFSKDVVSGGCLVEGTKIIMSDGSLKSIEDVCINDQVKTMNGFNRVTYTWNPENLIEGTPECYSIEFEDGLVVECSENHKFLVDGHWVKVRNLSENDEVDCL